MRIDAELAYLNSLEDVPVTLEKAFKALVHRGRLPVEGNEVSCAILRRMKAFYDAQRATKRVLGKFYAGAAADFFAETIAFYLKALEQTWGLGLTIASEKGIVPHRGAMRPDISVWCQDDLRAIIECKTQLGWNRAHWESDFRQREEKLREAFPHAAAFLVVATEINWGGFDGHALAGQKYFTLCSRWPSDIDVEKPESSIRHPIEPLLRSIVALGESNSLDRREQRR